MERQNRPIERQRARNWDNDRHDEGLLERIKNDVASWFESDDERDPHGSPRAGGTLSSLGRELGIRGDYHRDDPDRARDWRSGGYSREYPRDASGAAGASLGSAASGHYEDPYRSADQWDSDSRQATHWDDDRRNELPYRSGHGGRRDPGRVHQGPGLSDTHQSVMGSSYGTSERRGGYSGKGPKGYRRSPESLKEKVSERLEDDDEVDATDIVVEVADCEVTLTGCVATRQQKRRAEDCAESVRGVRDVHNQLRVDSDLMDRAQRPDRDASSYEPSTSGS